ncbi:MAG TPA: helical backbone metal receptor [Bacteroidia bacterium]|nr:helical backbone metal receptor [Bacteroidia bacterium]
MSFPQTFTDQMGREIHLPARPQRIVSLVPSQTELLHDLGLEHEVAGITKFCIHPESWFRSKKRVGGTKQLNFEAIRALQPDLIIGNKEENEEEQVLALMNEFPVWMSDIRTLDDALAMIKALGNITGTGEKAGAIAGDIREKFSAFDREAASFPEKTVAYFIWKNPFMVAGNGTFIHSMLGRCGWKNVFSDLPGRYPEITIQDLQEKNPELVVLSSEPYPFAEKHVGEFSLHLPQSKVIVADGEMFSWYGSRLRLAPGYFSALIKSL